MACAAAATRASLRALAAMDAVEANEEKLTPTDDPHGRTPTEVDLGADLPSERTAEGAS